MEYLVATAVFFAVTLTLYGIFYRPATANVMTDRLGGLRAATRGELAADRVTDPGAKFGRRVLAPALHAIARRIEAVMPANYAEAIQEMLVRAGSPVTLGQLMAIVAVTGGLLPILLAVYLAGMGQGGPSLVLAYFVALGLGLYMPRMWLLGRIRSRQKEIWRALPDAFDLVTASVEAGLGIDASFARVLERAQGPFADELGRALREIQVGRDRSEAFMEMANRAGVEELGTLIYAVVQAETMGISIVGVVRQQTHVLRTRRRQRAEEQAFKAPIKMVFPLVFLIFPAVGIVIGGPAIIQLMEVLGD